jgi:hypothetical protein
MDVTADVRSWAEQNFKAAELGDVRRRKRLMFSAAKIAEHPEKPFTQVFDWKELRGFYGLCNRSEATLEAVMTPHWQQTHEAMGRQTLALILHDTSELDFTDHLALKGDGPIGNGEGKGFLQHNSFAVVPERREVLGLAYQQLWVRQPAPEGETRTQRRQRVRESDLWLEGIRGVGRCPEGYLWVDVCDRGADYYEAMAASLELGHHFLIRAKENRTVFTTPEHDQQAHLLDYARTLASEGSDQVEIRARGGRPGRTATVSMAAAPVWIPAPAGTPQRRSRPIITAWVIRVWEANPPADVQEPLEWILICSLPTQTLEEIKERRDWYAIRWMVEIYHDIEKNGCSEEDRRFQTAEAMETCLAILSVVAVRVFQLRCALEFQPNAPAEQVATEAEVEVVRRFLQQKAKRLTVRDFVRGVAKLGGFLGRKHDREPGVRALWRGYQRLQDMLAGFALHDSQTSRPAKRG